jgi:glycine/D-amino acid oxidase-like deaminating enzyme
MIWQQRSVEAWVRVVICGGGVIAACAAYFLSRRGVDVTVVEGTAVACAASGKAGGFLAFDWCAGTPMDQMARRSFALHGLLPDAVPVEWGYRRMNAYSGFVAPDWHARRRVPSDLAWLSEGVVIASRIGTTETTAIVHPRKFTEGMMREAQARGTELRIGRVTGLIGGGSGSAVQGVAVDGATIPADAVLIAMGPWSILAAEWLRLPAVNGQKSPSVVYDTGNDVPADALFLEYQEESGDVVTVEVFPRADGSTMITAFSSDEPVPANPADVAPDPGMIEQLEAICERLSPVFDPARIIARQACFRPITQDFMPIIGKAPGLEGAYVATGHNVWGILNAPATGEAVSELIVDGATQFVDLTPFDPIRLRPLTPSRLRTA